MVQNAAPKQLYKNENAVISSENNSHLLLEFCTNLKLLVANTYFDVGDEQKLTSYNIGYSPSHAISWEAYAQIDFLFWSYGRMLTRRPSR